MLAPWLLNSASTLDAMNLIICGNKFAFIIIGGLMCASAWSAFLNICSKTMCVFIKIIVQQAMYQSLIFGRERWGGK